MFVTKISLACFPIGKIKLKMSKLLTINIGKMHNDFGIKVRQLYKFKL